MSLGRIFGVLGLLLSVRGGYAQSSDATYYPYAEPEERVEILLPDSVLFYRAVQSAPDRYGLLTDYNLPAVATRRRGFSLTADSYYERLPLEITHRAVLRSLGAMESHRATFGRERDYQFSESEPLLPYRASVWTTDRNYRLGVKFSAQQRWGNGWRGGVAVDARTGRDLRVEGVYTHAVRLGAYLAKRFSDRHTMSLLLIASPSLRGTRLSTSEEVFALTDDPYYNPAWGFQRGKVRNSRVRRDFVPVAVVSDHLALTEQTSLHVSLQAEFGIEKYSALNWYDARTPMPDNYRYLPSYAADAETEQAWLSRDAHITQIDWDELIRQNRMRGDAAAYTLEDRVERLSNLGFDLRFETRIDRQLLLRYGVTASSRRSRYYKQMRDLLGAQYVVDIDQYLVDDDAYNNRLQNNQRAPNRRIEVGDRFGYDYALVQHSVGACFELEYRADRLRADLSAEVGAARSFRRGYYEKELFAGAQSFGRSRRVALNPYRVEATAGWVLSPRHYLELRGRVAARMPEVEHLFYQPLYNNRVVEQPTAEQLYGAEFNYRFTAQRFSLDLAAYADARFDGSETIRYFDDLAAVYSDLYVSEVGQLAYGVEVAVDWEIAYRWRLGAAVGTQRARYIRNPVVTVLSDVDNTAVDLRSESRMGDCYVGNSPQITAAAQLAYYGPKRWGGRLSAGYAGVRYVAPAVLRRTDRVAAQGGTSAEAFAAFVDQQRLDDAFTVDAALFKTLAINRLQLSFTLAVRNLLGARASYYSGFESMRIQRLRAGDGVYYQPQATRYTHAYGRSFYISVGFNF